MVMMAARAPDGQIKLPDARLTRQQIIDNFREYMRDTRKELAVSFRLGVTDLSAVNPMSL